MAAGHRRRRRAASLTAASTAPRLRWLGDCTVDTCALEIAPLGQYRPGNARQFVGERDSQHIVMHSFFCGVNPASKPMALPAPRLEQHDAGSLHEQNAQIAITAL